MSVEHTTPEPPQPPIGPRRERLPEMHPRLVRPLGASRGVRLARAALSAALGVPGVERGHAGTEGSVVTYDGDAVLTGVAITASAAGRYVVALRLIARPPVAAGLARAVVQHVHQTAADRGLGTYLEDVSVVFESIESIGTRGR
jgi:hypothetical protein